MMVEETLIVDWQTNADKDKEGRLVEAFIYVGDRSVGRGTFLHAEGGKRNAQRRESWI